MFRYILLALEKMFFLNSFPCSSMVEQPAVIQKTQLLRESGFETHWDNGEG